MLCNVFKCYSAFFCFFSPPPLVGYCTLRWHTKFYDSIFGLDLVCRCKNSRFWFCIFFFTRLWWWARTHTQRGKLMGWHSGVADAMFHTNTKCTIGIFAEFEFQSGNTTDQRARHPDAFCLSWSRVTHTHTPLIRTTCLPSSWCPQHTTRFPREMIWRLLWQGGSQAQHPLPPVYSSASIARFPGREMEKLEVVGLEMKQQMSSLQCRRCLLLYICLFYSCLDFLLIFFFLPCT